MSADNYGIVSKNPKTGTWYVLQGFASDTADDADDDDGPLHVIGEYLTEAEAIHEAWNDYFEYGWNTASWPDERVQ